MMHFMADKKNIPFPSPENHTFTFIDLFAGIGGFHIALQNLGGKCVFTSEWDAKAQKTYENNFGALPYGDITKTETKNAIPEEFDVLCAGFPCQPFSKGGFRNGFEDTRGTLFFDLCEIIEKHQPKYLFLENVANMVSHDNGNTYLTIIKNLDELGYYLPNEPLIISPDKFGIPILRPRVYIPCVRKDVAGNNAEKIKNIKTELEKQYTKNVASIDTILDASIKSKITPHELKVLKMWDEFYKGVDLKVIGFPIWMEYFKHQGLLNEFPLWKAKFIQKNIDLYTRNKKFIDRWLAKHDNLEGYTNTQRKMEWQAGKDYESIFECLIQFRPSGVRVKRPDKFSTLVAMNHQQIIGKYKRRLTIDESKRLQSFPEEYQLSDSNTVAMKQLGNSVNITVIQKIFEIVLKEFA
jgi:DNA (cytosine-5)-methyltransferase 1|tara:strand:+ start:440 stop:1666 length:1227 start_codon:yes stop_codon:yes gene_type:complete